jgi:hypothetical protein
LVDRDHLLGLLADLCQHLLADQLQLLRPRLLLDRLEPGGQRLLALLDSDALRLACDGEVRGLALEITSDGAS